MSGNPLEPILRTFNSFSQSLHSNISSFFNPLQQNKTHSLSSSPLLPLSSSPSTPSSELSKDSNFTIKGKSAAPLTKEELGRNTWALLHTIAAQYPDQPTRQQKRDVKELMAILSRIYPCKECADHFKDVLRANPVQTGSQAEFSQWLCHTHNVVNRSLGKLTFPCQRVNARWGKLDCKDRACDLEGDSRI